LVTSKASSASKEIMSSAMRCMLCLDGVLDRDVEPEVNRILYLPCLPIIHVLCGVWMNGLMRDVNDTVIQC
jgi:hypothetical protein